MYRFAPHVESINLKHFIPFMQKARLFSGPAFHHAANYDSIAVVTNGSTLKLIQLLRNFIHIFHPTKGSLVFSILTTLMPAYGVSTTASGPGDLLFLWLGPRSSKLTTAPDAIVSWACSRPSISYELKRWLSSVASGSVHGSKIWIHWKCSQVKGFERLDSTHVSKELLNRPVLRPRQTLVLVQQGNFLHLITNRQCPAKLRAEKNALNGG